MFLSHLNNPKMVGISFIFGDGGVDKKESTYFSMEVAREVTQPFCNTKSAFLLQSKSSQIVYFSPS